MAKNHNRISVNTRIDRDLYERFKALNKSQIFEKTEYGSFSELCNQALVDYLKLHEPNPPTHPLSFLE